MPDAQEMVRAEVNACESEMGGCVPDGQDGDGIPSVMQVDGTGRESSDSAAPMGPMPDNDPAAMS